MKLILYTGLGKPHHKIHDSIKRMCSSLHIDYEESSNIDRLKENNYNILLSCNNYVGPNIIPTDIKIIFGPQFFVTPSGAIVGPRDLELSKRAVYNNLSDWIGQLYLECVDDFIIPMEQLPFSIDTNKFKPDPSIQKDIDCLVYIKRRSNQLIDYTLQLLNDKKINHKVFRYGSYNEEDYLNSLKRAKFMLTLDAHESQGFALEEAMSSGVPLLVMDATSMYDETNNGADSTYNYLKPKKLLATSVPYWSDECGIKITEQADLPIAIDKMMETHSQYTPRDYIVRTLSDEVCMRRILDYFKL
jgi:glycosyltransferase involved in cell wall biosynthesis